MGYFGSGSVSRGRNWLCIVLGVVFRGILSVLVMVRNVSLGGLGAVAGV